MFALSPWLQLPIVLAIALPVAGAAAWAMLRLTDWLAYQFTRARADRARARATRATTADRARADKRQPTAHGNQPAGGERVPAGGEIPPKRNGEVD